MAPGRHETSGRRKRGGAKANAKAKSTPKIAAAQVLQGRGRRRGGRRKASVNPRIDALNIRAGELKAQYVAIAKLQRQAMEVLAERSIDSMMKDSDYHKSFPEYDEVTEELQSMYQKRLEEIQTEQDLEEELARRTLECQEYIARQQLEDGREVAEEAALARIEEHAMYVWHQWMRNEKLDEIPAPEGSDKDPAKLFGVTKVFVPKLLDPIATPYTKSQHAVQARTTEGDTEYYQHPANQWRSLTSKGKAALVKERDAQYQQKTQAALDEHQGGRKRKREALFNPGGQPHATVAGDEDEDEEANEEGETEDDKANGEKKNAARTSAPPPPTDDSSSDFSSDAEEYPEDEYGVFVPKKRLRGRKLANNRIRYQPTHKYEPHEIGLRQHYYKKKTKQEAVKDPRNQYMFMGLDASPNREHFYFEQRANGYNTATMKPEDFNQEIIKAHGMHPRFGIPLPGSENVDRVELENPYFKARTDWTKDLPAPKSQRVVESFADGDRKLFHSSRSYVQEVNMRWENAVTQRRMFRLLEASDDHEVLFPDIPHEDLRRMDFLAMACNEQENQDKEKEAADRAQAKVDNANRAERLAREAKEAEAVEAREAARLAEATSKAATIPALGQRYDPVRDTTYQTPYPPAPAPRPALNVYQQGGPLSALADVAHFGSSGRPASLPLARTSRWAEPTPLPADLPPQHHQSLTGVRPLPGHFGVPQPMGGHGSFMTGQQQMGLSPNNYFLPPQQQQAPPPPPSFQSPRAPGSQGSSYRALQPAPPRGGRRTTPPQPQQRGWYRP